MIVCRVQIRYADLDTQGHVNNTAQLQYVEAARTRSYVAAGLSWQPLQVVRRQRIEYVKPLAADTDWVDVRLMVTAVGRTSHTVEFTIAGAAGNVFSIGECVLVTVDESGSPSPIPGPLRAALEAGLSAGARTQFRT
ncbi:thioesterase [Mycolicibacterium murale]|uniref:Thioesterase n=1 Tax=Mycolicibacterium murale TaxID=182220 RepID=A0A7I9WUA5_9MYCO|nr:thioesterase family protein [Mycolicibacterium murale]MCV7181609.1 acyl-CoA thioesterase [Mycolicibacterium murale]GFG60938.1 thioesterase [Mycolicibacterium murale]